MTRLPVHPNATKRGNDTKYVVTMTTVPTTLEVSLGFASSDWTTWRKQKYAAYGFNKQNAIDRAEARA